MHEISIETIYHEMMDDVVKYSDTIKRIQVAPFLYQRLSQLIDLNSMGHPMGFNVIIDPSVETYKLGF